MKQYKVYFQENDKLQKEIVTEKDLEKFCQNKTVISKKVYKSRKNAFYLSVSNKEILSLFSQLEVILNANIPLLDAIGIVKNSIKNKALSRLLIDMEVSLKSGLPIENAFKNHPYINSMTIAFFSIATQKGNLSEMVKALHRILQLQMDNKNLLVSKLRYPVIVLMTFLIALGIIFVFVIPKFEFIFMQYKMQLPLYTILLLEFKSFVLTYSLSIALCFVGFFGVVVYYYQQKSSFAYFMDKAIALHIPAFSQLYRLSQLYNFFITSNILMQSHYQFSEALDNAKLLLKNKYLLDKIHTINESIKNGSSIYDAFESSKLFDEVVLSLIHTGERSSSLGLCIDKIETIYEHRFKERIKHISTLIEPLFLVTMMLLILWVMLAIFTPIWNMSAMINY